MNAITKETVAGRIAYIAVSSTVTVLIFCVLAVLWQLYFNNPPIVAISLDKPSAATCPGAEHPAHSRITVTDPTMLYYYFSVLDEPAYHNYADTQASSLPRLHPKPATFDQVLPWTVPDLPPGNYTRVLGFRGTDGRERSIFLEWKFTIKKDCQT